MPRAFVTLSTSSGRHNPSGALSTALSSRANGKYTARQHQHSEEEQLGKERHTHRELGWGPPFRWGGVISSR